MVGTQAAATVGYTVLRSGVTVLWTRTDGPKPKSRKWFQTRQAAKRFAARLSRPASRIPAMIGLLGVAWA